VRRADLQAALRLGDERLGAEVVGVEADGRVRIAGRGFESADLVVGADGLRSAVRRSIAPDAEVRPAGYAAWRAIAPVVTEPGRWVEAWGRGARFGMLEVGGGETYWFATENAEPGRPDGGRELLLERFSDWPDPVRALIEATPAEEILRTDVHYLEPPARWSAGSVTLVGDAAHATTPGVGQGAGQALEDAVALGEAVAASPRDVARCETSPMRLIPAGVQRRQYERVLGPGA
jgi:2-polyprenyl-6-methoxyphenol hydroxylase-like FAD-dependent oxidoreductase